MVLFLKRTLKRSLFLAELRRQPVACEQYLAYLRARFNHADAADLLAMLGRVEEAAVSNLGSDADGLRFRCANSITGR